MLAESVDVSETLTMYISRKLFPLNEFQTQSGEYDITEDPWVYVETMHTCMSVDDYIQVVEEGPEGLSDYASFDLFLGYIWEVYEHTDMDRETYWHTFNERFHWRIPDPPLFPQETKEYGYRLNWKKFAEKMKRLGLYPLYFLMEATAGDTGNIFFDFTGEEGDEPPAYSVAELVSLYEDYKKAKILLKTYEKAYDILKNKPEAYKIFLDEYIKHLERVNKRQ